MREYLLVFVTAFAVTYLLAVLARELAMRFGAFAKVRDRDVHEVPIPYFGGVAMLAGLAAAILVASKLPFLGHSPDRGHIFHDARAILVGGALICLVGVLDDIYELDAITKLAGQVLAAGVVVIQGVQLLWLPLPGGGSVSMFTLGGSQSALLTVIIIVATTNAVNFVDGLDGLAAGVVGIGAAAFFSFSVLLIFVNGQAIFTTAAMLTAALAGACIGFLPHNFWPARMFMGDSGALLIGLMLPAARTAATDPAVRGARGAVRGSGACRRTANPRRSVAVLAGQEAPAPPTARDRALPAASRAGDVPVDRTRRLRGSGGEPVLRLVVGPRHRRDGGGRPAAHLRASGARRDHQVGVVAATLVTPRPPPADSSARRAPPRHGAASPRRGCARVD
jgi:UDP-GlcNAc:undecaprenyl-phosphate/decaprenyl-phosphate GlcNAc-1-phosphate transferase